MGAQYGHTDIVQVLLGAAADPNWPNISQRTTPLHVAAQYGHIDIVQVLLGAAADPNRPNNQQHTPLHVAIQNGHTDIVQLLQRSAHVLRAHVLQGLASEDLMRDIQGYGWL